MPIITDITPGRVPKMNVKDSQKEPSVVTHHQVEDQGNSKKMPIITDITPGRDPKMNVKDSQKEQSVVTHSEKMPIITDITPGRDPKMNVKDLEKPQSVVTHDPKMNVKDSQKEQSVVTHFKKMPIITDITPGHGRKIKVKDSQKEQTVVTHFKKMPIKTDITPVRDPKMNVKKLEKPQSVVTHHNQVKDQGNSQNMPIITDITPGRGRKIKVKYYEKPYSVITLKYGLTRKVWVDVYSRKKTILSVLHLQYAITRKVWVNAYIEKRRQQYEKVKSLVSTGSDIDVVVSGTVAAIYKPDQGQGDVSEDETLVGPETPRSEGSACADIRDVVLMKNCHRHRTETSWVSTRSDADSEMPLTLSSSPTERPSFKTIDLMIYKYVSRTTVLPPPKAQAYPRKLRYRDAEGHFTEFQLFETEATVWIYAEDDKLAVKKADIRKVGVDMKNFHDPAFLHSVRKLATKTTSVTAADIIETTPFRRSISDMSFEGGVTGPEMNILIRSSSGNSVRSVKSPQSVPVSPRTKKAKTRPVVASRYLNKPSVDRGRKATELPKNPLGGKPVPGKRTPPEWKVTGKTGPGKVPPTSPTQRAKTEAPLRARKAPVFQHSSDAKKTPALSSGAKKAPALSSDAKKAPALSSGAKKVAPLSLEAKKTAQLASKPKKAAPLAVDAIENLSVAADDKNAPPLASVGENIKAIAPVLSIDAKENLSLAIDDKSASPLASDSENIKAPLLIDAKENLSLAIDAESGSPLASDGENIKAPLSLDAKENLSLAIDDESAPILDIKARQPSSLSMEAKENIPLAIDDENNLPFASDGENIKAPPLPMEAKVAPPLAIKPMRTAPLSIAAKENLPPAIDAPPLTSDAENNKAKAPSKKKCTFSDPIATICSKARKNAVDKKEEPDRNKKMVSRQANVLKRALIIKIFKPEPQKAIIYPKPVQGHLESFSDPDDYIFPTLPELAPLNRFFIGISQDPAVCPEKRAMTEKLVQRCEESRDVFESRRDPDDDASNRDIKSPNNMRPRTKWTDNLDYLLIVLVLLLICYSLHLIFTSPEPVETFLSVSGLYIFLILAYFLYALQ